MNTRLNKSDWTLISLYYGVAAVLNIIDYKSRGLKTIEYFVDIPTSIIVSIIIILLFMYVIIPKFLIEEKKYFHFIFSAFITLTFFGVIDDTLGFLSGGKKLNDLPVWYSVMINGIYTSANNSGFIFGILFTKKFYESQTQILAIERQKKENELKLLRSQIDPHFLFNNLNTLDSLIDSDSEKAKEYINRLSLIYRYLIQTKDAEVMELSKELSFAENYIFLIETRFGTDYKFTIEKEANISDKFIPTGALQALLENVVKHNKANGKPIQTKISITNNWLRVNNTKSNNPNKESFGTGLVNLQGRYELLSDKKVDIKNANNRFIISIPILNLSDENE
ncbi:histidine kinase [uncultured Tenacibaculum sp.]|uniref:sensor histidine kinase n=1 Tax=uncultured Tenacibaculum sp. TaxID=174713 RepID=UPI0026048E59|nr:histidine kinase [uncultured Tenacibaculum sp.]